MFYNWEKIFFIFLSSLLVLGTINFLMLTVQRGDASRWFRRFRL